MDIVDLVEVAMTSPPYQVVAYLIHVTVMISYIVREQGETHQIQTGSY